MPLLRLTPLLVCLAALSSGCKWLSQINKPKDPTNLGKLEPKPAQDFVGFLNRQSSYVQTIRYDYVSLKAELPDVRWVPRLNSGMLVCGKDRNFLLQAGLIVGGDQIEVGSNSREMWMYVRQPEPTYLVCSHADFPRVQNELPVPFEPDWVLQALGMTNFPDRADYQSEVSETRRAYLLSYTDRGSNGQPLKKVIEFAGDRAEGTTPQVRKHTILTQTKDQKWEVQTVAEIKQVQTVSVPADPRTGAQAAVVQIPTHLMLEWPKQKVKMELKLGELKVNDGKTSPSMFVRRATIGNVSPINLAEYRSPVSRGAAPQGEYPPGTTQTRRK